MLLGAGGWRLWRLVALFPNRGSRRWRIRQEAPCSLHSASEVCGSHQFRRDPLIMLSVRSPVADDRGDEPLRALRPWCASLMSSAGEQMSMTSSSNAVAGNAVTMVEALRRNAKHMPERLALRFLPASSARIDLSFAELDLAAAQLAGSLRTNGIGRGDRVLMFYLPGIDFVIAFFAVLYAGAVAVPLSPPRRSGSSRVIAGLIDNAEPTAVLTSSQLAPRISSILSELGCSVGTLVTDQLRPDGAANDDIVMPDPDEICVLQYTSGSTGSPRGVMVTHGNAARNAWLLGKQTALHGQSVWVSWVPHFHDLGLFGGICTPIYHGITSVLMPPAAFVARPVRWLEAISQYGGTVSIAPNFAYDLCLRQITEQECAELDLRHWTVAGCGAEPIKLQTMEDFAERFGPYGLKRQAMCPFYGLAEATLLVSGGPVGLGQTATVVSSAAIRRKGLKCAQGLHDEYSVPSSGRPSPEHRILIVDPETKQRCASEMVGEIWIDGSTTGAGYWRNPEETARVFNARLASGEGPFLRTGDLGFMQDGTLYVSGRIKDVMIIRGQNLYPQDLEAAARQTASDIADAAAFTVADEATERAVLVIEEARRPIGDAGSLIEQVRAAISAANGIELDRVVLTHHRALPKTSSGKIQRSKAREMLLDGTLPVRMEWCAEDDLSSAGSDRIDPIELILRMRDQDEADQIRSIENYLGHIFGELIGLNADDLDRRESLMALGVTSLGLVRVKSKLETDFMMQIDSAMLWHESNCAKMAEQLHARLRTSPLWANADVLQRLADEVAQMGDEDVARELGSQAV
ncbi:MULTISPECIES: AMP-binding protein [unclassified Bradyrhizobium]|uniref:AMP-binding protein n=2 Tax=unclassified Bradyrhizobium TaxID=2631580 RepID=UPI0028EFC9FF|nr:MULTISPECIES: AMP-binding protein [unclassified Bradyrhizobium]